MAKWKMVIVWIILILFTLWTVIPFIWAGIVSIKPKARIYDFVWIPYLQFKPTGKHWYKILFEEEMPRRAFLNSVVVATCSAALSILLGGLAGYALSRFRFERWKNRDIAVWILSQRMFPPVAVAIPFFLFMFKLGLIDKYPALILAHTVFNLPLAVWILMDFFNELPKEIEEAALVDGASHFSTFVKIVLPLALPGLVAVFVLCFLFSWNELLFAIILTHKEAITLPVLVASTLAFRQLAWWDLAVYSYLSVIPPIIIAILTERWLIRGLTLGAVKG